MPLVSHHNSTVADTCFVRIGRSGRIWGFKIAFGADPRPDQRSLAHARFQRLSSSSLRRFRLLDRIQAAAIHACELLPGIAKTVARHRPRRAGYPTAAAIAVHDRASLRHAVFPGHRQQGRDLSLFVAKMAPQHLAAAGG